MDPETLKKLTLGIPSTAVSEPDFVFWDVGEARPIGSPSSAPSAVNQARDYLTRNPGETVTKKFTLKTYTLALINGNLYWRAPKPAPKLNLQLMMRGSEVPSGTVAGLATNMTWYVVESVDQKAISDATEYLTNRPGEQPAKEFDSCPHTLTLSSGQLYWKQSAMVQAQGPPTTPEPLLGLRNDNRDWLTYETLFNQRPYRKTNQKLQLGLYRIPLSSVKIFVRDGIAPDTLAELAAAFFPDLELNLIREVSLQTWKWKKRPQKLEAQYLPKPQAQLPGTQYAIFPYNFEDNGDSTHAIGHRSPTDCSVPLQKLNQTWSFWKTASRSLVVDLQPVKAKGRPWQPLLASPYEWPTATMPQRPSNDLLGSTERGVDLNNEHSKGTALRIADTSINLCGVKTGVQYVGWVDQQGVHKDKLEENSVIACMRSDLIVEMDRVANRNPAADPDMIVQTELLSLTEIDLTNKREFGDGVQVRDFTILDRNKIYFPPISIPFVDLEMKVLKRRFECVGDQAWREYWKDAYAVRLGKAKAMLLLRYGLQMGSPNAQNFLIELTPAARPVPGRIVLRDVGDMYLHREVLWAKLGGVGLPPQRIDDKTQLQTLKSSVIQYECTTLTNKLSDEEGWRDYLPYETGSLYEASYGPRGTRFGWHAFSTLAKGSNVASASELGTDPDAYSDIWREACAAMCEWGVAHNRAYIIYIETTLGVKLSIDGPPAPEEPNIINWANAPKPDRYRSASPTDKEAADSLYKQDREWEKAQEDKLHAWLASTKGQDALRAHENKLRMAASSSF